MVYIHEEVNGIGYYVAIDMACGNPSYILQHVCPLVNATCRYIACVQMDDEIFTAFKPSKYMLRLAHDAVSICLV